MLSRAGRRPIVPLQPGGPGAFAGRAVAGRAGAFGKPWDADPLAHAGAGLGRCGRRVLALTLLLPLVAGLSVDAQVAARRAALEKRRAELTRSGAGPDLLRSRGGRGKNLLGVGVTCHVNVKAMSLALLDLPEPSLTDRAANALRADVLACRPPPGAAISEGAAATRLGLGKAPVRAALARLADEGWA